MQARQALLCVLLASALLAGGARGPDDDDDDEYEREQEAPVETSGVNADGLRTATVTGFVSNEQFRKMFKQHGKVLRILLDGGAQQAPVRFDGSFSIYEVAEGVHMLDVDAPGFLFDQVRLEVMKHGKGVKVKATSQLEALRSKAFPYPLKLEPRGRQKYFEEREKFDITVYLKNPMVIMGVGVTLMAFVLPKMVENMDPDEVKKMKDDYKDGGGTAGVMKKALQG
ncbi:hypothetical protein T484DRAFT_1770527 [Baffinella frigidus]|nr:hypothetical protein T484DRAFT_1770527 [Cryptophyta sp. CCMP2293]